MSGSPRRERSRSGGRQRSASGGRGGEGRARDRSPEKRERSRSGGRERSRSRSRGGGGRGGGRENRRRSRTPNPDADTMSLKVQCLFAPVLRSLPPSFESRTCTPFPRAELVYNRRMKVRSRTFSGGTGPRSRGWQISLGRASRLTLAPTAVAGWGNPTLQATQGQIDGFFSQLPYTCHQNRVASVGDGLDICPWVASRVEPSFETLHMRPRLHHRWN